MASKTNVFQRTLKQGEQTQTVEMGFFGYNANRIFDVFANHSKIGKEKMAVSSTQFKQVMDVIDNINAANRSVVEISGGRRLDDLNFFDKFKDAFFAPRDVRFTDSALLSGNVIVTDEADVVASQLSWAEFNDIIGYLSQKSSSGDLNFSAIGREAIHGRLDLLEKRLLIITDGNSGQGFDAKTVKYYIPRETDKLLAPVVVSPNVAKLLYNESRFISDVNEFCDEYIEGLRIMFEGK